MFGRRDLFRLKLFLNDIRLFSKVALVSRYGPSSFLKIQITKMNSVLGYYSDSNNLTKVCFLKTE